MAADSVRSVRVEWFELKDLDTSNAGVSMRWHCYDAAGKHMTGYANSWARRQDDLSIGRRNLLAPLIADVQALARAVLERFDSYEDGSVIQAIQIAHRANGIMGISVRRHPRGEPEFVGELLVEQHAFTAAAKPEDMPMLLNYRQPADAAKSAQTLAELTAICDRIDDLAHHIRVEKVR